MRLTRYMSLAAALALCGLGTASVIGCHAEAQIGGEVKTPPPPPPPPPPDQDGDGILDPDDKCPTEAEDQKPPDPSDGCPNLDEDGDGIPVPQDKCPGEPETVNEFEDDDGCPDKKPLVQVVGTEVKINQKIRFKKNSDQIEPEAMEVVEAVAAVLKEHSEIQLVEVGGHASKEGNEYYNRSLSDRRVKSVRRELIKLGVEKQRLVAVGYGYYCPRAEGEDEATLERNRRVEFKILYRDGKLTDAKRGCDAAAAKGIKPETPKETPWTAPAGTAEPAKEGAAAKKPAVKAVESAK
jgi:OOP family OmpA-OmpF porin